MNIVSKVTGDSLTATEFNQIPDELENLIEGSGQSLSDLDNTQVFKSVIQLSSSGDFYSTSGTANDIVLTQVSPRIAPLALVNGLKARFKANYTNTGNVTLNLCNLGQKNVYYKGGQLNANSIKQNCFYEVIYEQSSDTFVITEVNNIIISVKDFGAVGDGVTDDTQAIQNAINSITNTTFETTWSGGSPTYGKGGGTVFFPQGRYRITDTILVGQHCRLLGVSTKGYRYPTGSDNTGSVILADFATEYKWIIETANYKSDGTRLAYNEALTGADIDNGVINATHGVIVENLVLNGVSTTYGGIRLVGSPNSKLDNIGVYGKNSVSFWINASWQVNATNLHSLSYLHGIFIKSVNGAIINGYFDCFTGHSIDNDHKLPVPDTALNSTVGLTDVSTQTCGIMIYSAHSIQLNNCITEKFGYGRIFTTADFTDICGHIEGSTTKFFAIANSSGVINSLVTYTPSVTKGYNLGYDCKLYMNNVPASGFNGTRNSNCDIQIADANADANGWTYDNYIHYIGMEEGVFRIASSGNADNTRLGINSSYITLGQAFTRIEKSPIKSWKIIVKDEDICNMGGHCNLRSKHIEIVKEGTGNNPTIVSTMIAPVGNAGYPTEFRIFDNCSFSFRDVNLKFTDNTIPKDVMECGIIYLASGANLNLSMVGSTIELQTDWSLLQQTSNASNLITNFRNCTITGSSNACIMRGQTGGYTNVINGQTNCTVSSSIINWGNNGWRNANVIASNFS